MPNRPNFPIPENIHAETFCLCLEVPNDPTWKQVLKGLLDELNQWYNWQRDDLNSGRECAHVWRPLYNQIDWTTMSCCCGNTPPQIFRWNGSVYEVSNDSGATWTPAPGYDYRNTSVTWPDPNELGLIVSKCQMADGVIVYFRDKIMQQVNEDMGAAAILGVISAVLLAVLTEGTTIALTAQVTALVTAALTAGVAAWLAAFTTEVWDDLLCMVYNRMDSDSSIGPEGFAALLGDINSGFIGIVAPTLYGYVNAAGSVGLTNMMRSAAGDPDANCDSCNECDTVTPNNSGYSVTVGLDEESCIWTFDAVVNPSGAPGAPPYVMGIDFGAGSAHIHLESNSALGGYGYGWFVAGGSSEQQGITYPQDTNCTYWYAGGSGPFQVQLTITP